MTGHDPYLAPETVVSDAINPAAPIRWGWIIAWGLLVFLVKAVIYVTSGFIMSTHEVYGIEVDDMIACTAIFLLYSIFLRTISSRHFQQISAVFVVVILFDLALSIAVNRFFLVWAGLPNRSSSQRI